MSMANRPRYFFAMFGEPQPPFKDAVESGVYHPDPNTAPFPVTPGDVLLLYCTGSYPRHEMEVPGVGMVIGVDDEAIEYRYLPFVMPIPKHMIDSHFMPDDLQKFGNRRFSTFWLFELSKESFTGTVGSSMTIDWP